MWRRYVIKFGLILPVIFERLPQAVQRILHVGFAEDFARFRRSAEIARDSPGGLRNPTICTRLIYRFCRTTKSRSTPARDVGQLSAHVRITARTEKFSQTGALGIHGKGWPRLIVSSGGSCSSTVPDSVTHAHGNDARRLSRWARPARKQNLHMKKRSRTAR